MDDAIYKVLWVDDDPNIVEGYRLAAGKRNIILLHALHWADAQVILEREFDELTAIILDANCKWDAKSSIYGEFLRDVLSQLNKRQGRADKYIPWYILSAGTMEKFDEVVGHAIDRERKEMEPEWGQTLYLKDQIKSAGKNNPLFDNIRKVGARRSNNIILYRHRSAFRYLGDGSYFSAEARHIMLKVLSAMYYPEENLGYTYAGNPIRKVIEYMFRGANKWGLLPNDFFDDLGNVNIWDSMQYLFGQNPNNIPIRFGNIGTKKDYSDYDSVLPVSCLNLFKGILNFLNVDSHTKPVEDNEPYTINVPAKDLFFGYAMQILYLISYLGNYIDSHQDVKANLAKATKLETGVKEARGDDLLAKYKNFTGTICQDSLGNYHIDKCLLSYNGYHPVGKQATITKVDWNTKQSKDLYPLFAVYIDVLP